MSRKRLASEMDAVPVRSRRVDVKRTKTAPSDDEHSDSSTPSSGSVSVASALESSPPTSHRRQSSVSSLHSTGLDDSESSLSSSSEESSIEDSDEETVVTVGGPKKPAMRDTRYAVLGGAHELNARISALLPQLAAANSELEAGGGKYSIEDVNEGEQHIEMNLGLGVLEEKGEDEDSSSEEDTGDGSEVFEADEVPTSSGAMKRDPQDTDTHVMGKLMGQKQARQRAGVQILD